MHYTEKKTLCSQIIPQFATGQINFAVHYFHSLFLYVQLKSNKISIFSVNATVKKTRKKQEEQKFYSTTFVLQINAFPAPVKSFNVFYTIPFLCAAVGCDSPKLKL